MLFPAAKNMDWIVGVDVHTGIGFWVHPFFGPIYVWLTPKYPEMNVFINNQPACTIGGTSYSVHIPTVIPSDLTNTSWRMRAFLNIPKVLILTAMTVVVNIAIALTTILIAPHPGTNQNFIKEITGINVTNVDAGLQGISGAISSFTKWQTWVQLLMSALPYPLANGAPGIANPTVLVNGAPLATGAPLTSITCSDFPFSLFPNAMTLATSNVMVGLSLKQFLMGMATNAAKGLIQAGIGKLYSKAKNNPLDKFDPEIKNQQNPKQNSQQDTDSTKINNKKNQSKTNKTTKNCK